MKGRKKVSTLECAPKERILCFARLQASSTGNFRRMTRPLLGLKKLKKSSPLFLVASPTVPDFQLGTKSAMQSAQILAKQAR